MCEGAPLLNAWQAVPLASRSIHQYVFITLLLLKVSKEPVSNLPQAVSNGLVVVLPTYHYVVVVVVVVFIFLFLLLLVSSFSFYQPSLQINLYVV